jgi:hypothetical protein
MLNFGAATLAILALGILFAGLGAWLRTWGSAYVGASIVQSTSMHGNSLLADGPYRRTRNPLYLGTCCTPLASASSCLRPAQSSPSSRSGSFRSVSSLAEEPFLAARFGEPYSAYKSAVPRFLPSLKPLVPSAEKQPHWLPAILGESYMIGVFVTLAAFGWSFNAQPLRQLNPHLARTLAGRPRFSAARHNEVDRSDLTRTRKHEGRSRNAASVAVSGLMRCSGRGTTSWAERWSPWRPWPRGTSPRSWP